MYEDLDLRPYFDKRDLVLIWEADLRRPFPQNPKPILDQRTGLNSLGRFLLKDQDFESLGVFNLDINKPESFDPKVAHQFYLGKSKPDNFNIRLNLSRLGYVPNRIFVVPQMIHLGENAYYWIDFTEDVIGDEMRPPFQSQRLLPHPLSPKIDARHWRGLGEQLLVDLIQGNNNIQSSDLFPFTIKLDPKGNNYSLGGMTGISVRPSGSPHIRGGDELLIVPNTDSQSLYTWFDLYKAGEGSDNPIRLSPYRVIEEKKTIYGRGWKNPETQYLIDYLSGSDKVTFDNLMPVRVPLLEKHPQVPVYQGSDHKFSLSIGSVESLGVKEAILVPKQDSKKLYQWVEAYKFDSETEKPIGDSVSSARLIPGTGFEEKRWFGVGKQTLFDCINGERTFDDLSAISLRKGASRERIDLWHIGNEVVYMPISVKSNIRTGSNVELVPTTEEGDSIVFKLFNGSVELGTYSFDKTTKKFTILELHDLRDKDQPRDLLVDYSRGNLEFDGLKTIQLKVTKSGNTVSILSKRDLRIYITMAKSFNLKSGDELELIPQEESESIATFSLIKDGIELAKYNYDAQTMKFSKKEDSPDEDSAEADAYLRDLVFGGDI